MKGEKMRKEEKVYAKMIDKQTKRMLKMYGKELQPFLEHINILKDKAIGELLGNSYYEKDDLPVLLVIPKSIIDIERQMIGNVSLVPPPACGFIVTPPINEKIENISKPFRLPYFLAGVRRKECKEDEIGSTGNRRFINAEEVIALLTHFPAEIKDENLIFVLGSKFFGKPLRFSLCEKYHRGFFGDYYSDDPTLHGEYRPGKPRHFEKLLTYTFRKRIV